MAHITTPSPQLLWEVALREAAHLTLITALLALSITDRFSLPYSLFEDRHCCV